MRIRARVAAAASIALVAAALAGCSSISAGTITAKEHEPRRVVFCSVKPLIPCVDDEDRRFDIVNGEESGYVYVTPEEFEQYDVGDYYGEMR